MLFRHSLVQAWPLSLRPQRPSCVKNTLLPPQKLDPSPRQTAPPLTIGQLDVLKCVGRFRAGSAPGPSGLRPEHLKLAFKAPPARKQKALESLTRFVNAMLKGEVPGSVAPYLCGAKLHAANKKDGGLRPIAVGNLTRRLVAKCAASSVAERAAAFLAPNQLGGRCPWWV